MQEICENNNGICGCAKITERAQNTKIPAQNCTRNVCGTVYAHALNHFAKLPSYRFNTNPSVDNTTIYFAASSTTSTHAHNTSLSKYLYTQADENSHKKNSTQIKIMKGEIQTKLFERMNEVSRLRHTTVRNPRVFDIPNNISVTSPLYRFLTVTTGRNSNSTTIPNT